LFGINKANRKLKSKSHKTILIYIIVFWKLSKDRLNNKYQSFKICCV